MLMTGKSLDQVRNSAQPPDAPGFANDESQPLSPLMANRWVSQMSPKIKSSFLKIPPWIHNARFSRKILTIADVSQTTAFMGTSGCPCSRKFCEAKNTNPCLRLEPVDRPIPSASSRARAQISFMEVTAYRTHRYK